MHLHRETTYLVGLHRGGAGRLTLLLDLRHGADGVRHLACYLLNKAPENLSFPVLQK
jgi:hypothetical protein